MTRYLGASILLSVALVVFFAVVLYQPEGPPPVTIPPQSGEHGPKAARARPEPTPAVPLVEAQAQAQVAARRDAPTPADRPDREMVPVQPVSRARLRPEGRSSFTEVGAGESLADVALRVYGSSEAARKLWMANRDILDRHDAPLDPGTLLRTP